MKLARSAPLCGVCRKILHAKELDRVTTVQKPHRSIGVMVLASLTSAACGVVLTFFVPKLLSVDDFGIWRTFLLYAGYAGLLHLGLVDGALLLWSRTRSNDPGLGSALQASPPLPLLSKAIRFLVVEHLLLIVVAAGFLLLHRSSTFPVLLVGLALFASLFNLLVLVQVYLQAGLRFAAVAFGTTAPTVFFVFAMGGLALTHLSIRRLIVAYLAAWSVTLVLLIWVAYRRTPHVAAEIELEETALEQPSAWRFGLSCIAAGWPIVLANTGFGLMQSADRVTVNLTRPLHDFAIYSLSQSTIYVPITILAAVSRVAFSWFARAHLDDRASLYRSSTRLLTLLWMLLLPYFFVVDLVVRRFLPRYAQGLPAGLILLLSLLFLSLIQIIQLNTYSLEGRQRQFFLGSLLAVVVAFATAWLGSEKIGTLTAVAWSQVLTAALWWLGNEWMLRNQKLLRGTDVLVVQVTFCLSTAALYLTSMGSLAMPLRVALYYGVIGGPAFLLYRAEIEAGWVIAAKFIWSSGREA